MSGRKTLSPPGPMSLALRIWTSFWRREGSDGMDMWNAPTVQSRQPLTYRLMESVGLGGPRWHGSSWQRGIVESGNSRPSILMIDIPGDLVRDQPCVQQASYLKGGPLMWMLPLYLHVNQKSDYDDDDGSLSVNSIQYLSLKTEEVYLIKLWYVNVKIFQQQTVQSLNSLIWLYLGKYSSPNLTIVLKRSAQFC